VFAAQAGPGIENAFPGIAQAFAENVPMMVVPATLRWRGIPEPVFRAADVYRPVTKWSALAHSVQELPDLMRPRLPRHAQRQGGRCWSRWPPEVWEAEYKGELDYTPMPFVRTAPDPDAVKQAVRMLLAAKAPVLWAGQGVHYAEAGDRLAALAELIPAPVVTTNPARAPSPRTIRCRSAPRPARAEDVHRLRSEGRSHLAVGSSLTRTPFGPSVPPARPSSIPPTRPATSQGIPCRSRLPAMRRWCSRR